MNTDKPYIVAIVYCVDVSSDKMYLFAFYSAAAIAGCLAFVLIRDFLELISFCSFCKHPHTLFSSVEKCTSHFFLLSGFSYSNTFSIIII